MPIEIVEVHVCDAPAEVAFDVTVHVGVHLSTRLEVAAFEPNQLIAFESRKGLGVTSRWGFEAQGSDQSRATAEITVRLPFVPAGTAMGRLVRPAVTHAVATCSRSLRRQIEAAVRQTP